MPDATHGVPVVQCEYADNTPATYLHANAAERIGLFPITTTGTWYPADEAAARDAVIEAAVRYVDSIQEESVASVPEMRKWYTDLKDALDAIRGAA